jgi:hypothetical protein
VLTPGRVCLCLSDSIGFAALFLWSPGVEGMNVPSALPLWRLLVVTRPNAEGGYDRTEERDRLCGSLAGKARRE